MSIMLVGPGGQGKSHITATSPGPILIADLEAGAHKLPRQYTYWSAEAISNGEFPANLTEESIVVVLPESVKEVEQVVSTLHSPASPFRSFWIESATVLTQMGEVEVVRANKDGRQGFGDLLRLLQPMFTALKKMTLRPDLKLEVIGVTAWQRDDKQAPSLQGGIGSLFNHTFDVCGYVSIGVLDGKLANFMRIMAGPNGTDPKAKGTGQMYVKYLDGVIPNPNFTELNKETSNH